MNFLLHANNFRIERLCNIGIEEVRHESRHPINEKSRCRECETELHGGAPWIRSRHLRTAPATHGRLVLLLFYLRNETHPFGIEVLDSHTTDTRPLLWWWLSFDVYRRQASVVCAPTAMPSPRKIHSTVQLLGRPRHHLATEQRSLTK